MLATSLLSFSVLQMDGFLWDFRFLKQIDVVSLHIIPLKYDNGKFLFLHIFLDFRYKSRITFIQ